MKRYFLLIICLFTFYSCNSKSENNTDIIKILFIGNSYIYNNNLPDQIKRMADEHDNVSSVEVKSLTPGGAKLQNHLESSFTISLLKEGTWDIVIFQGNSLETLNDPIGFEKSALTLTDIAINAGIEVYFFETWARAEHHSIYTENWSGGSPFEMQKRISNAYDSITENAPVTIIPIGRTWKTYMENNSKTELYSTDGSHPSALGSYLTACTIFTVIFEQNPTVIKFKPDGVSDSDAKIIRMIVADFNSL